MISDAGGKDFHERYGLDGWYAGIDRGGQYEINRLRNISASYLGQVAEIIAIQPDRPTGATNALGETNNDASLINPYRDVVIQFLDNTVAMTSTYLSVIFSEDA